MASFDLISSSLGRRAEGGRSPSAGELPRAARTRDPMNAEAETPRARPETVEGLLGVLLVELGWSSQDERAGALADWLARHLGLARAWNRERAAHRAELPRSARVYNRRAQRLALELASQLGISTALRVA